MELQKDHARKKCGKGNGQAHEGETKAPDRDGYDVFDDTASVLRLSDPQVGCCAGQREVVFAGELDGYVLRRLGWSRQKAPGFVPHDPT